MQIYDDVRVINNKEAYEKEGIYKGMVGRIILPEIRDNCFEISFIDEKYLIYKNNSAWFEKNMDELEDDKIISIKIEDLELVEKGFADDKTILEELPQQDPRWWCKVEEGYIMNLLGEKKNKIPYDYNS